MGRAPANISEVYRHHSLRILVQGWMREARERAVAGKRALLYRVGCVRRESVL